MGLKVLIIGHPLIAEENRLPFQDEKGIKYFICCPDKWRSRGMSRNYKTNSTSSKIITNKILFSGYNSFFIWKNIRPLIKKIKPDFIYSWSEPWCLSTFQLVRIAKTLHVPFCFYTAENIPKKLPILFNWIQSYVYKNSQLAVTITEQVKNNLLESGYKNKLCTIPLWIQPGSKISPSSDNPVIAYLGRLIPLKRVDLIIRTLIKLPKYKLVIIGDGPDRERLENVVHINKLDDRVKFKGAISNVNLSNELSECCLMVLPTDINSRQEEQFGKAALESISIGIPVLTSNSGNYKQLSKEFNTVWSIQIENEFDLRKQIVKIINNYPSRKDLNDSSLKAIKNYSYENVANKWQNTFTKYFDTHSP